MYKNLILLCAFINCNVSSTGYTQAQEIVLEEATDRLLAIKQEENFLYYKKMFFFGILVIGVLGVVAGLHNIDIPCFIFSSSVTLGAHEILENSKYTDNQRSNKLQKERIDLIKEINKIKKRRT